MTSPLIISTWSFGQRGNEAAWPLLAAGGSSLDAVERACCVVEADPEVDSVGYGGLPDRDGHVSLDACIMVSPSRCGSVCNVGRHLHVASIARAVMERTPHIMLAGAEADDFADACGLPPAELLNPEAKLKWEQWRSQPREVDQSRDGGGGRPGLRPIDSGGADGGRLFTIASQGSKAGPASRPSESRPSPTEADWKHHDTIGVLALDSKGELAGACSTSGTPFKTPGRVGDSPIIGHGLYVDPRAGAAVATGTGELIMGVCGSFLAVELMRRGEAPSNAIRMALDRIVTNHDLRDHHQVALIAMTPSGEFASGALRPGFKLSLMTSDGGQIVDPDLVVIAD
jgi:isoaspartyl peptidase/L-asparaginase-like protein (Ntn-hydrolase superfamily)